MQHGFLYGFVLWKIVNHMLTDLRVPGANAIKEGKRKPQWTDLFQYIGPVLNSLETDGIEINGHVLKAILQ